MKTHHALITAIAAFGTTMTSRAAFTLFEASGANPVSITATRDAFRSAVGGGNVAGADGNFGGLRREINWDGVPEGFSDPASLPANFFNTTSSRGVVLSTPGTGFLVSANAGGATPPLFGFPNDFQFFSGQKIFTAVGSASTDISFFVPGTNIPATTTAFGLVFTDVEVALSTRLEFFGTLNELIFSQTAQVSGNQGLTFLGAIADAGETITRVRITSGTNTILSNGALGDPNNDAVAMDDFLFATPVGVPEPGSSVLLGIALVGAISIRRR